ncbi:uncharacterized protein LOC122267116 [Penaeus japonicus]|uniref:uncharacterized protein LOC122267116 n=1 Tax=Penaeus japonicus TaxID=27405 RepID=UPI001C7116B2|nr:uncharacterized protein LOC122267116 [Penaeus japonicus]
MDSIQCNARTNNSGCAIASPNITGVCACDTHFWAYNASLCVHQTSLDSMTWTWIFKKIVNDMCSVTFTVRTLKELYIHLGSFDDWHDGITQYYIILGGWSNTQSILDSRGTRIVTASTPQLMINDFQNFTLHWCNGQIRVRLQDGNDFISWDDPTPFVVRTIGFHIPSHDNSHLFFPHNLVDPYFPTSVETGTIRTNGHHWHQCKIMPDASHVSKIKFRFECMAVKDCKVLFGYRTTHSHQYQILFGSNYNANTQLFNALTGTWVVVINTPNVVSGSEFRRFWIDIDGPSISIGQGDDTSTPLISYTDTVATTRTFTHISIATCCNDYGYWKVHSHPQFHEYPNGAYVI